MNKSLFDPKLLAFARRFPQRAKVMNLPSFENMAKLNHKQAEDKKSTAMIEYMRAQEMSQQEVINAWDQYQESFLSELLEAGCPEDKISISYTAEEDYSGTATIEIDSVPFAKLIRQPSPGETIDGKPTTIWDFTRQFLDGEIQ